MGSNGSRRLVDATLGTSPIADNVDVKGSASGTTTILVNSTDIGDQKVFTHPVTVLTVEGGNSLKVANLNMPVLHTGLVDYVLQQAPGNANQYQITSVFNTGAVSGVATGLSGVITGLSAGFHQAASAIVSRPDDCRPNQLMGGPFIRASAGHNHVKLGGSGDVEGGGLPSSTSTSTKSDFEGFQTGADIGLCNINGSDWNINAGLLTGTVHVTANSLSRDTLLGTGIGTKATLDVPFAGFYTFVSRGPLTAELNVRRDFYDANITTPDPSGNGYFVNPNTKLKGTGTSINGSVSYRVGIVDAWYVEPQLGISRGSTDFGHLDLASNPSDFLRFDTVNSLLGRVGFNAGTAFVVSDKLVLAPFVNLSVWREMGGTSAAHAIIGSINSQFDVQTQRVGTFGQFGGGLQFKIVDTNFLGFLRGDLRFGDKISGRAVNAGVRMQF